MKHVITIEGEVDPQTLEQYAYYDLDCDIKSLNDSGLAKLYYTIDKGKGTSMEVEGDLSKLPVGKVNG